MFVAGLERKRAYHSPENCTDHCTERSFSERISHKHIFLRSSPHPTFQSGENAKLEKSRRLQ